jgi:hypothetical protein
MDDNVWEYPFGDLDDDEEIFFREPEPNGRKGKIVRFEHHEFSV